MTVTTQATSTLYYTSAVSTTEVSSTFYDFGPSTQLLIPEYSVADVQGNFSGIGGKELRGEISANATIDFYIMNDQQAKQLMSSRCGQLHPALLTAEGITNYPVDWTAPPSDNQSIHLIFTNCSGKSYYISVSYSLWSYSYEQSSVYTTGSSFITLLTEITVTSQSPASPFQSIPGFPIEAILVGLVLGIALAISTRRRRSR